MELKDLKQENIRLELMNESNIWFVKIRENNVQMYVNIKLSDVY